MALCRVHFGLCFGLGLASFAANTRQSSGEKAGLRVIDISIHKIAYLDSMKFNLHGVLLFFRSFFSRRGAEAQSVRGVFVRQDLQDSQDYFDHPK